MLLGDYEHGICLAMAGDPRATEEEKDFLGYTASLIAAREDISTSDYLRLQALRGGLLGSHVTPISRR